MHNPVLLQDVVEQLCIKKDGVYIDATAGEGGHLAEFSRKGKRVLAIDRDNGQIEKLKSRKGEFGNVTFAVGNFSNIETIAKENGFEQVDGILFDLGLSWNQLDKSGKGLSYRNPDETLDMRLDESCSLSAAQIVSTYTSEQLADLFIRNAEEMQSERIADSIVATRKKYALETVGGLLYAIDQVIKEDQEFVYKRIFQALRIEVNDEFGNLYKGLVGATHLISKGGRVGVITFHSLEDRKVKQFVRTNNLLSVSKKAIHGDRMVRYERSAKLRVFSL